MKRKNSDGEENDFTQEYLEEGDRGEDQYFLFSPRFFVDSVGMGTKRKFSFTGENGNQV